VRGLKGVARRASEEMCAVSISWWEVSILLLRGGRNGERKVMGTVGMDGGEGEGRGRKEEWIREA
jgi:hypothetical protein